MQTNIKSKAGRHSKFSAELGEQVCQLLISGISLNQIGKMAGFPTKRTIIYWLHDPKKKAFLLQYQSARKIQIRILENGVINIDRPAEAKTLTKKRLTAPAKNY
jgi:hypothetical protein